MKDFNKDVSLPFYVQYKFTTLCKLVSILKSGIHGLLMPLSSLCNFCPLKLNDGTQMRAALSSEEKGIMYRNFNLTKY